jgi:hypothetical protein
MADLDTLYARLVSVGFVVLREAIRSERSDWIDAEIEMLHNVPSLIGESNVQRHRYYWFSERPHYIDWVQEHGGERAVSRMSTFYEPLWREMEPSLAQLFGSNLAISS